MFHLAVADLPLGINPGLFLTQLVNFGLLYFILARYAFPALFKTLDQRAATIRDGIENAKQAEMDRARAKQQGEQIVLESRQHGQQIIAQASAAADRLRAQAEVEARARAEEIAEQGRRRMAQEEAQARTALRQQTVDLAIQAAGAVVGKSLEGPDQRRLVEEFIAEVH